MKERLPLNLTKRLVLSHLLIGIFSIGLISAIAAHFIIDRGRREVENFLEDTAFLVSNDLEQPMMDAGGSGKLTPPIKSLFDQFFANRPEIRYTLYQADGTILTTTDHVDGGVTAASPIPMEVREALAGIDGESIRLNTLGQETYYVAIPISHQDVIYGALRLSGVYADQMGATYHSLVLLGVIAVLLVLAVILEAWWMAGIILRPIRSLTQAAEQLSQGNLEVRANPTGPEELLRLAETFNQMASHLQDNMDGLRAFVANASHELRTPLTAIKLNVDALHDGALDERTVAQHFLSQVQDEVELMNRTVTDLLDLSKIEAGRGQTEVEPVDVSALLEETRDFWRVRAQQAGLELKANLLPGEPKVLGDEDQLRRLVNNLVENAIKNTPAGGKIELALSHIPEKGIVRLEVKDNGIGISEEHIARIFERFYRVEPTQLKNKKLSGSGLGLAIAKSIVEAHGGKIGVTSKIGAGSTFWVELPVMRARYEERKTSPRS